MSIVTTPYEEIVSDARRFDRTLVELERDADRAVIRPCDPDKRRGMGAAGEKDGAFRPYQWIRYQFGAMVRLIARSDKAAW